MKKVAFSVFLFLSMLVVSPAWAEDLAFPTSEAEIVDALRFKQLSIVHQGKEYVSTGDGEIFLVIEGKYYRMKGIGGVVRDRLVPKAGALVTFDFDSSEVKDESFGLLDKYGKVLRGDLQGARLVVEGHTDDVGTEEYNADLSKRRAAAVRKYLVENCKVSPDRLVVKGAGKSRPVASNATDEGRQLNRRVEFIRLVD